MNKVEKLIKAGADVYKDPKKRAKAWAIIQWLKKGFQFVSKIRLKKK